MVACMGMLKSRYAFDTAIEAGIDEAGRGCLFGPLCAAAVIWQPESEWNSELRALTSQIKDSKQISAKKRAALREQIQNYAIDYGVGRVEASEIDELGMTRANLLAFERALRELTVEPDRLLVDGILHMNTSKEMIVEVGADNIYVSVAAASIIAKEAHDEMIGEMCAVDPSLHEKYDILKCKGYGTMKHREGVRTHGMHAGHRKLFLRKLLGLEVQQQKKKPVYDFIDE